MLNNYYIIIVNILSTIRSHLTMYFPVEQCFIVIIKFVKNIFVVNYYFRSYSFTTERTEGKKL